MTELGGPSTQAGIYYQNSVAALYLADLLELEPAPPRDRVVFVRVEAPSDIDDIVVEYADGHCGYLSAKLSLRAGDQAWISLWKGVQAQVTRIRDRPDDQVILVVAEARGATRDLKELCERATSSTDAVELAKRLTSSQVKLLRQIGDDCRSDAPFELVRRVSLRVLPEAEIVQDLARRRFGRGGTQPATMLSVLRDLAGGYSRSRAMFRAPAVRRVLAEEHGLRISEPNEWGIQAYRQAVERASRIEVPATGLAGPASEMFVWPRVCEWQRPERMDFEDELALEGADPTRIVIDLKTFPSDQLQRCVIVAGPGYGKSALLNVVAARLAAGPVVPVLVPLASLAASGVNLQEFLQEHVNHEYDVQIDWRRLAEQGLVAILLDGLDEVPNLARAPLLDKLRIFSARYRQVPWLLTVRDPAVLTGAIEARTLEILPLGDGEIAEFAKAMQAHCPQLDCSYLVERLDDYPDLKWLARIPLFLAIMLATIRSGDEIPASRGELIERYLHTLFAPSDHKSTPGPVVPSALLRAMAARLAFERLESTEIGASDREIRVVASAFVTRPEDIEPLQAALLGYGVLRRQSPIRFQFPFPIVQEYLAATYIVEHSPETLTGRIDDAIQRPWAQVLQFALELHPNPAPIIREILARADDAFATNLRLVARCIVNGARVDEALRAEAGDRLIYYWVHAHHFARRRLGQLILDGFARPISPGLRKALHCQWLFTSGAGDILARENDRALTLSVLKVLLQRPINIPSYYHSLKPAISAAGNDAFACIIKVTKETNLAPEEWPGLGNLLHYLDSGSVARDRALEAAHDPRLPTEFRLNCCRIAGRPLAPEANQLLYEAFCVEDSLSVWVAIELITMMPDPISYVLEVLRDAKVPEENRVSIAARLGQVFHDPAVRDLVLKKCADDLEIPEEVRVVAMLFAARHGDQIIFERLIDKLPTLSLHIASQTISLFGHYPGRALAERAATLIEARTTASEEVTRFANSAVIGMLYIYELEFGFGGVLVDSKPHTGMRRWAQLLDTWSDRSDLNDTQRIGVLTSAAALGSNRARNRIDEIIKSMDPDDPRYCIEDEVRQVLRAALDEAQRHAPLPLAVAARFARAKEFNVASPGITAIAAHADRAALDMLLVLYAETAEWFVRGEIERAVETLSTQLGIFIQRDGEALKIGRRHAF